MPTGTYYRLPEEKRRRIEDAAIDEIASYSFDNISINRIVKAAGIPRGSFYQYFSGKEDIYLLIMNKMAEEKMKILSQSEGDGASGFFETVARAVPAIFTWAEAYPRYRQIGLRVAEDGSEFVKNIVRKMDHSLDYLKEMLLSDQQKGLIREGVDLNMVIELYFSGMVELLKLYGREDGEEKIRQGLLSLTDILLHGIGVSEKPGTSESVKS